MVIYEAEEITVRGLEEDDAELLVTWLSDPRVLEYYEGRDHLHDLALVKQHFYKEDHEVRCCIVEFLGRPVGYIQYYLLAEEAKIEFGYKSEAIYGTDQFIGEVDYWNRGVGRKLVTSMLDYLINQEKADKVIMDPQVWNHRAIACYEKCGLRKIKILKEHEEHEGMLRDCWLMEYSIQNHCESVK